ncbi:MAG: mevalonate kinase, partial [Thermococcus sp.]|nr:mevalonate kinase [Thermococcus sp.]
PIVVGYTGSSGSTKELVTKVRKSFDEMPEIIDPILSSMGKVVEKAREIILAEYNKEIKFELLGRLMNINHGLLDALGVSTKSLSDLVYASREAGALGAKITGAGGGGCMYALAPGKQSEVATAIKIAGGMPIVTKISREGLRIEDIVQ